MAGCLGGRSGGGGGPAEPPVTSTLESKAERPEWARGESWTYAVEIPGEPTRTFQMMVAEDRGDLWVVASSDRGLALHQAIYSTNPVLGRINKTTLSPFQGGGPVSMFQFPLVDGKAWAATLFGESMSFACDFVGDIDTGRLPDGLGFGGFVEGFRIVAEGGSGRRVLYDYVDAVEWFTSFEVLDGGGEREIKLTLVDLDADYRGPYHFFRGSDALVETETHAETAGLTTAALDAPVPDDAQELVGVGLVYRGASGTVPPILNVTLRDPAGATVWSGEASGATQNDVVLDFGGQAGTWKVELRMTGNLEVDVRVVGIQKFAEGNL